MNDMDKRAAIFLDEMGIGVQWQLRQRPVALATPSAADSAQVLEQPAVAAPLPVPEPVPVPVSEPVPVPAPAPASVPVAAAAPTAPSSPSGAGEDMSWFDDVPAPAVAPKLKGAAPTRSAMPEHEHEQVVPQAASLSEGEIAALDWAGLHSAITHCTRCQLCHNRPPTGPVPARGSRTATTMVVVAAASAQDETAQQLLSGDPGQLGENMLKAIELDVPEQVYLTALVKCRPLDPSGQPRAPRAEELQACRPYLERELALTGATLAITFGQHAARGLMLGAAARGAVMHYGATGLPVVATYHPDDLLQRPLDKAKAWADLCLARSLRD